MDALRKQNAILYYDVIKYHQEFTKSDKPVNIFQLMHLVGSEMKCVDSIKCIDVKFLSYIPLGKFHKVPMKVTQDMLDHYPWYALRDSIWQEGIKIPLVVERFKSKEAYTYMTVEGKHRIAALSLIEPFNLDYLVPCILIEYNSEYTKFMFKKFHPNPLSSEGFYKGENR